ncbi:hypothetical protein Fmac_032023 [Flemingia macrophylla]|uniref:Uncharacterized protein n=1 Tax=Flemingia macrophylla TaxID=520843 RepID=A0ABD1L3R7_9FABA
MHKEREKQRTFAMPNNVPLVAGIVRKLKANIPLEYAYMLSPVKFQLSSSGSLRVYGEIRNWGYLILLDPSPPESTGVTYASTEPTQTTSTPFAPYGAHDVIKASAVLFFAYMGFGAVSTMVEETNTFFLQKQRGDDGVQLKPPEVPLSEEIVNRTVHYVSAEQRKEVLIIKTTIHDIMNKMIQGAEKVVLTMLFEPDAAIWRALLSGCAHRGDVDKGSLVVHACLQQSYL